VEDQARRVGVRARIARICASLPPKLFENSSASRCQQGTGVAGKFALQVTFFRVIAKKGRSGGVIAISDLCPRKSSVLYERFRLICRVLDLLSHAAGIRAPARASTFSNKLHPASVAAAFYLLNSVAAQLRAIGLRRVPTCPANLGQQPGAFVARLLDPDSVLCENSCLLFNGQSHGRSLPRQKRCAAEHPSRIAQDESNCVSHWVINKKPAKSNIGWLCLPS